MNTLIPQYLKNFQCIGSKCEDTCCSGWKVIVDEKTYRKYRKSNHPILKTDFQKKITRQRSDKSSKNFAKIKMKENGDCSFLTNEKLCGIQLNLGEEYLSNTCSIYPRIVNKIDESIEKSASMSCPEAARIALLDPNKMEFEHITETLTNPDYIAQKISTKNLSVSEVKSYFWDIRIFSIELIQNRDFSVEDRLVMLGVFCKSLKKVIDQKKYIEIPDLINKFKLYIKNNEFEKIFEVREVNTKIKLALCEELIEYKIDSGVRNERYLECLEQINNSIIKVDTNKEKSYKQSYIQFYNPFMKKNEHIMENYIVNYIYKSLFSSGNMDIFDEYIMLTVHFSLIKYHLIGLAGFHQKLDEDLVIKLIQSYSKVVEHNYLYLSKVLELIKKNKMNNIAYMTILIKN